jgi:hypothetical protein
MRAFAVTISGLIALGAAVACSGGAVDAPFDAPPSDVASCGTSMSQFTTSPVAPSSIMGWVPLGALNPPGHTFPADHQYIYITSFGSSGATVPVYAPGNITITGARVVRYSTGSTGEDYGIDFTPCREVSASFGHVRSLSPTLLSALGSLDQQCSSYSPNPGLEVTNCFSRRVNIKVTAGDVIGTTAGLDLLLFDTRAAPAVYANNTRWISTASGFDHFHIAPFSDYYVEPARSTVRAMLGSFDGKTKRTAEPIGGTIATDVAGTAQGAWLSSTAPTYPETPHLAIVPDNVDPSGIDVSIGASQPGMPPGAYSFVPVKSGTINRDPSTITPSQSFYCWEIGYSSFDRRGVVIVQLPDSATLVVDARSGSTRTCAGEQPWSMSSTAFTYKR